MFHDRCRKFDQTVCWSRLVSTVSFTVSSGEKIGVVGPNGSGKTTLLKMIAGDEPLVMAGESHRGQLAYLHQEADVELDRSLNDEMWTRAPELYSLKNLIVK
ncbi:MAG: hypothetical protein CM1200mP39_06010 [Dehalococcoidia bacterium]|nr:MAG: hypothetical protein CM1200mP39_06010 [Dehalococcoidia bacterium]